MSSPYSDQAKQVFALEARAIAGLSERLTQDFSKAIEGVLASKGRLVVCGMGKSGLIGTKIVATLASTGTPSFFMHPGEAYHGDLGMVTPEDVFLAISNSGETDEVVRLIPFLKDNGNFIIAMTGRPESTLARHAHCHLNIAVEQEACPLQLAPTSSTTATLVMGDALAVVLMQARGFKPENFARFHPGGSLGRRLLTRVEHVMKAQSLPRIALTASASDVIHAITRGRLGLVGVSDAQGGLAGVITDGDLRRHMERAGADFMALKAEAMMNASPKTIGPNATLAQAEALFNEHKITSLLVVDAGEWVGVVQIYDL
jgi:arabinose-5-phosphate isomerase